MLVVQKTGLWHLGTFMGKSAGSGKGALAQIWKGVLSELCLLELNLVP